MSMRTDRPDHEIDDSENIPSNPTENPEFRDIASAAISRRNLLKGSLAAAAAGFLAPSAAMAFGGGGLLASRSANGSLIGFTPLSVADATASEGKTVTVSPDYDYQVLIPWGTPIDPASGVPEYTGDPASRPTWEHQEQQIGIGHDGMWFFSSNLPWLLGVETQYGGTLPSDIRRVLMDSQSGMMCINHEFGTNPHVIGADDPSSLDDVRLSQSAHGVSVVAIRNLMGQWQVESNPNSRRITVNTPVDFSGPAAGSPLLQNAAGNEPAGTVNNCGSGPTPWGTYLTCEENFNGYFGTTDGSDPAGGSVGSDFLQADGFKRYGFLPDGFGYGWHLFDPRFDLVNPDYANESNRFGWCVEIDPFDATKKPVKRTALGRFKHEAAAFKELNDGRVAVYMGDDQRSDYCYKYESHRPWREAIAAGESPLDDGKLYVAVFGGPNDLVAGDGQGVGEWVELTAVDPRISAVGLDSQDKVLVYARLAADAVGATKMDRPEWTTIGTEGEVYWTLTNNTAKDQLAPKGGEIVVNEVNPILDHSDGHIIRTDDLESTRFFTWRVFILARNTRPEDPETGPFLRDDDGNQVLDDNGNPIRVDYTYADYTPPVDQGENVFTDPDAAWADPFGRLFIGTDGGQPSGLQDQLVVFDVQTGEYKRLLMGVNSDEITGITTTPDYKTLFTNTQHPGNGDPTRTNFPAPNDGVTIPRDCTLVVVRKNGGVVGS